MGTLKFFLDEFRDSVVGGDIEFVGEDNANWKFALMDIDGTLKWVVQDGYIEWGEPHEI